MGDRIWDIGKKIELWKRSERMNGEINSYRDLKVWQLSMDLVIDCYRAVKLFPKHEQFGLSSQLQRAAVSIPANIAEGHGRSYTKEYLRHIAIAKGSLVELETHIQIADRLNYCGEKKINELLEKTSSIGRMLTNLRKSLIKRPGKKI